MLSDAGGDINNNELVKLELPLESHKEAGKKGFVDYVLFNKKGKPVAVVEAKKSSVDPIIGRQQAVEYANTIERDYNTRPIVFYTNYRILESFEADEKELLISTINATMEKLARLKLNINQFDGKRELAKSLLEPFGWDNLSYEKLEQIRIDLRDLMKHKGANVGTFVVMDIKDTGRVVKEVSDS